MYVLREDIKKWDTKYFFVCSQVTENNFPIVNWIDGKTKISQLKKYIPFKFITDVKSEPGDYARTSNTSYFLGNEKLKSCFEDQINNGEIEVIPVEIYNKVKDKKYFYWLFNVLNVKTVINIRKSKISKFSSHLQPSFLKIALKNSAIDKRQSIFYDTNLLGEYIITEQLATKILSKGLTGMEIIPIQNYTDKFYKE